MNEQNPESRMFFIVGRGRSGTTLLSRALGRSSEVAVAPEALFVMSLFGRYGEARWNGEVATRFARDLWCEDRLLRWNLDRAALTSRLAAAGSEEGASFARLAAEVYRMHAERAGKRDGVLLGDKNPHYALFSPTLARIFPDAKFIHLVRDYRDNILSYASVRFDLSSVPSLAYRWRRYNEEVLRARHLWPERFLEVRYEDLVLSPDEELGRICRFLGVPFEPTMLEFHRDAGTQLPWHRNVARPFNPVQLGKWRSSMSTGAIAIADFTCQPLGSQFGYASTQERTSLLRIRTLPGLFYGWLVTELERILFRFPLALRTAIIRAYRAATGNRIRNDSTNGDSARGA